MKNRPPVDKDLRIWKIIGVFFFGLVLLAALWECQWQSTIPCDRLITRKGEERKVSLPEKEGKEIEIVVRERSTLDNPPSIEQ